MTQRTEAEIKAAYAIAVGRPLIERAARAAADAEIAELRASLAKAEEALEPFASLAQYGDRHYSEALDTDETSVAIGYLRRARAALSDLRKARGEAQ